MRLNNLYKSETPLVICNVWDVSSAKLADKLGFKVIGTSSAAIAAMLGYNDGEEISFDELLYIVKRIKANTDLPLTVDIESGYSTNTSVIVENLQKLIQLGVEGINIEDSIVNPQRQLVDSDIFSKTINDISKEIDNKLFINVRTDTYLLDIPGKLNETLIRISKYEQARASQNECQMNAKIFLSRIIHHSYDVLCHVDVHQRDDAYYGDLHPHVHAQYFV